MVKKFVAFTALVAGFCAATANAGVITVTAPILGPDLGSVGVVRHTVNPTPDIQLEDTAIVNARFAPFDATLFGPLQAVEISMSYVLTGTTAVRLFEATTFPADVSGTVDFSEFVRVGAGGAVFDSTLSFVDTVIIGCTATAPVAPPDAQCGNNGIASVGSTVSILINDASMISNFSNFETIVSLRVLMQLTPSIGASVVRHAMSVSLRDLESAQYSLTYFFDDGAMSVPEPGTLGLLAAGLLGLAFRRKKAT